MQPGTVSKSFGAGCLPFLVSPSLLPCAPEADCGPDAAAQACHRQGHRNAQCMGFHDHAEKRNQRPMLGSWSVLIRSLGPSLCSTDASHKLPGQASTSKWIVYGVTWVISMPSSCPLDSGLCEPCVQANLRLLDRSSAQLECLPNQSSRSGCL